MSFESKFHETFKHSILIVWSEEKQKWTAECPVLNIQLEAEQYRNLLAEIMKETLLQDDQVFQIAEQYKSSLEQ